jgi:5-formyltetrahydrofolate cyclo-ligase
MEKDAVRERVWDALEDGGAARFPFPPDGRIPNFAGAGEAAQRLLEHPLLGDADRVKVNPDAPQRHVREVLLEQGTTVYMPTPRLRAGFKRFDPDAIPAGSYDDAASLAKGDPYAAEAPLEDLPQMDAIVAGSVAVTGGGRRVGKGEGYSDLEYAILRELGHDPVPVATTVHPLQVVDEAPREPTDLPLSLVVTPEEVVEVEDPPPAPDGIDWDLLDAEDLEEMPVLRELRGRT